MGEGEPSVSASPWVTERVPGRHPERDAALPDTQTYLPSTAARSQPDPHFESALLFDFPSFHQFYFIFLIKLQYTRFTLCPIDWQKQEHSCFIARCLRTTLLVIK